jgi:hypothetical protein
MHLATTPHARSLLRSTTTSFFIAIAAYSTPTWSQNDSKDSLACPTVAAMSHQHLQGRWRAELPGGDVALLQLNAHPDLTESVRGTVQRGGATAQVSGDVDGGDLTLEESINGKNISATWTGQVVDGSCGKEIHGTWNNANPTPSAASGPFVLRKQAGWQ